MAKSTKALEKAMGLFKKPKVSALKKKDVTLKSKVRPLKIPFGESKNYYFKSKKGK